MVAKEDLKKLKEIIDSWECSILPKENAPYTASLVNEEEPYGLVVFKGRDGIVRMSMLREDYDAIREYNSNMAAKKLKRRAPGV